MQELDFPVNLKDGVQIFNQTDDGFYVITYKNAEGNNSVIWLPVSLELPLRIDSNGGKTIEIVKNYIRQQMQNAEG